MTSPPQGPTNGPPPGPQWGPIPTSGLPPAQRPPKKRRKWPWIAAGVVLALLVIAGIASANSPKPTSATLASPTLTTATSAPAAASLTTAVSASTQPTITASPTTSTAPQPPTTVPPTPLPTTTVPTTPNTPAIAPQQPPPAVPAAPPVVVAPIIPPPPAPAPPANLCGAPPNPYGYNYCGRGANVSNPPGDVCTYFTCIANFPNGKGYMEECRDGTVSKSGGIRGSCSQHGGDQRPVTS